MTMSQEQKKWVYSVLLHISTSYIHTHWAPLGGSWKRFNPDMSFRGYANRTPGAAFQTISNKMIPIGLRDSYEYVLFCFNKDLTEIKPVLMGCVLAHAKM